MIAIIDKQKCLDMFGTILPSGVVWGTTNIFSVDGRAAMPYEFDEADQQYLTTNGAIICEQLPSDFEVKQDEI